MSAPEKSTPMGELLCFLSKYDDIRRSVAKESSAETKQKLRGLTLNQHTAVDKIMQLTQTSPKGVALRDFAKVMRSSPSSASVMVDSLVNRGLLERSQNPTDRRTVCIRLSEKGKKLVTEGHDQVEARIASMLETLTDEERDQLAKIMAKLNA